MTIKEIYTYIDSAIIKSKEYGYDDFANALDDALHLGSSGLEILGAIRNILIEEKNIANKIIGKRQTQQIINFIEHSYGII